MRRRQAVRQVRASCAGYVPNGQRKHDGNVRHRYGGGRGCVVSCTQRATRNVNILNVEVFKRKSSTAARFWPG